jgi:hypothetical protein
MLLGGCLMLLWQLLLLELWLLPWLLCWPACWAVLLLVRLLCWPPVGTWHCAPWE